jgi:thiosulfate/3-mercaptopyruvate sulfurtransferase
VSSDPFVEVVAISSLGPVRYLDARDQASFDAGHIPNAVRVPVEAWDAAAKARDTGFEKTSYWDDALTELGVEPATTAVIYDSGTMTNAARVWFILQYFGLKAAIINGGWPALGSAAILPTGVEPATTHVRTSPGAGPVGLVDRMTLKQQLDGRAHVFDTRTAAEFTGQDQRKNPRGGHLPGARLLPHANLLDHGFVRSPSDLRAMLEGVGFGPGDHIVTHCEGGGRAALGAAAAVRAGFEDVRVYYLSFADWARDETCPIIREAL